MFVTHGSPIVILIAILILNLSNVCHSEVALIVILIVILILNLSNVSHSGVALIVVTAGAASPAVAAGWGVLTGTLLLKLCCY